MAQFEQELNAACTRFLTEIAAIAVTEMTAIAVRVAKEAVLPLLDQPANGRGGRPSSAGWRLRRRRPSAVPRRLMATPAPVGGDAAPTSTAVGGKIPPPVVPANVGDNAMAPAIPTTIGDDAAQATAAMLGGHATAATPTAPVRPAELQSATMLEWLVACVKQNPGAKLEELASATGIPANKLRGFLRTLQSDRKIRIEQPRDPFGDGRRPQQMYFVVGAAPVTVASHAKAPTTGGDEVAATTGSGDATATGGNEAAATGGGEAPTPTTASADVPAPAAPAAVSSDATTPIAPEAVSDAAQRSATGGPQPKGLTRARAMTKTAPPPRSEQATRVLESIREHPDRTVKELSALTLVPVNPLRLVLHELSRRGDICFYEDIRSEQTRYSAAVLVAQEPEAQLTSSADVEVRPTPEVSASSTDSISIDPTRNSMNTPPHPTRPPT